MAKIKDLTLNKITQSRIPLVIGYFSCVHVMHEQLLNKFHHFNVLTFKDFYTKKANAIYSFDKRIENIESYKPDIIFLFDINRNNMTAQEFIDKILLKINPSEILVGSDFKFGSDQKGVELLKHYFKVVTIQYNKHISTTKIVNFLKKDQLNEANNFLSEPYYYVSKWIKGRKLGTKIGYKTINLKVNDNLLLGDGVYITKIRIKNRTYKSVTFLGTSQTTKSNQRTLETYVINKLIPPRILFTNSTKNDVKLSFITRIRKNRKFSNVEKLRKQIALDEQIAINYFKGSFK